MGGYAFFNLYPYSLHHQSRHGRKKWPDEGATNSQRRRLCWTIQCLEGETALGEKTHSIRDRKTIREDEMMTVEAGRNDLDVTQIDMMMMIVANVVAHERQVVKPAIQMMRGIGPDVGGVAKGTPLVIMTQTMKTNVSREEDRANVVDPLTLMILMRMITVIQIRIVAITLAQVLGVTVMTVEEGENARIDLALVCQTSQARLGLLVVKRDPSITSANGSSSNKPR